MTIQKFIFVCNLLIYNQGGMWLIINIERRNERYKTITMKRYKTITMKQNEGMLWQRRNETITKRKRTNVMGTSVTSRSVVKQNLAFHLGDHER